MNSPNPNQPPNMQLVEKVFRTSFALASVLHERVIYACATVNEAFGFEISPIQNDVLAEGPITLSAALEEYDNY